MPQIKVNFVGDRLDPSMPEILQSRMKREEWNHFVREINAAIHHTQSYIGWSPWLICCLVMVAIIVVLFDVALNKGVFGNPQIGTLLLSIFVALGVLVVCFVSMRQPTRYCEDQVAHICEAYSDAERNLFFFYRHHNTQVSISENRFYIEVFVGDGNDEELPQDEKVPRYAATTATSVPSDDQEGDIQWEPPDDENDDDNNNHELVVARTSREASSTALLTSSTSRQTQQGSTTCTRALVPTGRQQQQPSTTSRATNIKNSKARIVPSSREIV